MAPPAPDPRPAALAQFLRQEAGTLSLSAELTGHQHLVQVGLALLDAAALAEDLHSDDPVLVALSEAGCFESMPDRRARFVSGAEVERAILRPVSGTSETGSTILANVVAAVADA